MRLRTIFSGTASLLLLLPASGLSESWRQESTPPQDSSAASGPATGTQTTTLPAQSTQAQGSAPLRVLVNKSLLINTTERLKRISVTDPAVAFAQVITPTQILVHGRSAGEVSLLIWDELERSRSFDLRVDVDVSACAEEEKRVFPDEQITVSPSRSAIVLSGHVSTEDVFKKAGQIAEAYSKGVVNVLTFGPVGSQEILLEVKFAEVDRSAQVQLGVNLFTPGAGNTVATSSTGQFGGFQVSRGSSTTSGTTTTTDPNATTINLSNALNLFLFRPDINVGAVIEALQTKNLLQILAEPNLIAVNGKEASFLAGGEFPFPVVQPSAGVSVVTIQFREFGVKLKFTPVIMPNGNIHLRVVPEVSQLDFTNSVTIGGVTIPALSTRRADTEFEVLDGQSFVIAGLMNNTANSVSNKVPWLGDIPIVGNFFRSKNVNKSNTELMVMVTAHRVSASPAPAALPKDPQPFLDRDKFDQANPPGKMN